MGRTFVWLTCKAILHFWHISIVCIYCYSTAMQLCPLNVLLENYIVPIHCYDALVNFYYEQIKFGHHSIEVKNSICDQYVRYLLVASKIKRRADTLRPVSSGNSLVYEVETLSSHSRKVVS